MTAGDIKY